MRKTLTIALFALLLSPQIVNAEGVQLRSGERIVGTVTRADFETIDIKLVFPKGEILTFAAKEIAPASLYEILAVRFTDNSIEAHLKLARFCLENELYKYASVELEILKTLEAKPSKELAKELAALRVDVERGASKQLLEDAQTYISVDKFHRARLFLNTLLKSYPKSRAAVEARKILKKLERTELKKRAPEKTTKRGKAQFQSALKRAKALIERADKETLEMKRHFTMGGKDERLLKRAGGNYGKALKLLGRNPATRSDDELLNKESLELARLSRARLTKTYLELGRLYLARGAIEAAEQCCVKACELEPEQKSLHALHEMILRARLGQRFGGY